MPRTWQELAESMDTTKRLKRVCWECLEFADRGGRVQRSLIDPGLSGSKGHGLQDPLRTLCPEDREALFHELHELHQICPACWDQRDGFKVFSHVAHIELESLLQHKQVRVYVRPYGKPEIHVPPHPAFKQFFLSLGMQKSSFKYDHDKRCYLTPWTYKHSEYGWWTTVEALSEEGFKVSVKQSAVIKRGVVLDDDICNGNCRNGDPSNEGISRCTCVCGGKYHAVDTAELKPLHKFHFILDKIEGRTAHRTMTLNNKPDYEGPLIKELRNQ